MTGSHEADGSIPFSSTIFQSITNNCSDSPACPTQSSHGSSNAPPMACLQLRNRKQERVLRGLLKPKPNELC